MKALLYLFAWSGICTLSVAAARLMAGVPIYLSFTEREEIALLRAQDVGVREIARLIG